MAEIVCYEHHGNQVYAQASLAGKHAEHCLCYACSRFIKDDRERNCPIANALYELCVEHGLATPVYECAQFRDRHADPDY